ncbi:MAG: hypothetical protein QOE55_5302, partial [Acidobacteriaceae bacterium]|nr:hypothetical protein [Acidobacteriaceae bacterium]
HTSNLHFAPALTKMCLTKSEASIRFFDSHIEIFLLFGVQF